MGIVAERGVVDGPPPVPAFRRPGDDGRLPALGRLWRRAGRNQIWSDEHDGATHDYHDHDGRPGHDQHHGPEKADHDRPSCAHDHHDGPPTTTTTAVAPPPTTTAHNPVESEVMERDAEGPAVADLQERLQALRFWVGPVGGVYGWLTEQAVYAFQKANDISVDGRVGPETRAALASPVELTART